MPLAELPALGGPVGAEGQFAGGGRLEAHLAFDVGGVHPVALAELTGVPVERELRHQEEREPLGPRARALGARQDEVDDVLREIVLTAGDEALDALQVPRPVVLAAGRRASGADVRSRVRFGEDHRRAPAPVHHPPGDLPLLLGSQAEDHRGEGRETGVHPQRRVGAQDQLPHRPEQRRGAGFAAQPFRQAEPPPFGVEERLVGLLEPLGKAGGAGLRIEDRRRAVRVGEGVGQFAGRQPLHLDQDVPCGVLVHLGERTDSVTLLGAEHLEEVELQVAQVGLVVPHGSSDTSERCPAQHPYRQVAFSLPSSSTAADHCPGPCPLPATARSGYGSRRHERVWGADSAARAGRGSRGRRQERAYLAQSPRPGVGSHVGGPTGRASRGRGLSRAST